MSWQWNPFVREEGVRPLREQLEGLFSAETVYSQEVSGGDLDLNPGPCIWVPLKILGPCVGDLIPSSPVSAYTKWVRFLHSLQ